MVRALLVLLLMRCGVACAFWVFPAPVHQQITWDALSDPAAALPRSDGTRLAFTSLAIEEIITANRETDAFQNLAFFHVDDESFPDATQRLVGIRDSIVEALAFDEADSSLIHSYLGTALHTAQDFYAHSNWVENHSSIAPLGEFVFSGTGNPTPCDGTNPLPEFTGLTSGWVSPVTLISCTSWAVPGKCTHGPFALYASCGLNKDQKGRDHFASARDQAVAATTTYIGLIVRDLRGLLDNKKINFPAYNRSICTLLGRPLSDCDPCKDSGGDKDGDGICDDIDPCADGPFGSICKCGVGSTCPAGETCESGYCMDSCSIDADCGVDRSCLAGTCKHACTLQTECPEGYCAGDLGACLPNDNPYFPVVNCYSSTGPTCWQPVSVYDCEASFLSVVCPNSGQFACDYHDEPLTCYDDSCLCK